MKEPLNNYLPVTVIKNGVENTWYIDIDKISLSELFQLRKELLPFSQVSVRTLDKLILSETNSYYKFGKEAKEIYRNAKIKYRKHKNKR